MFEPMGAGIHGVEAAEVNGKTVLVSGCGPIGLTAISASKTFGAVKVIACDLIDEKLEVAKKMGADAVLNSAKCDLPAEVRTLTGGVGVDAAIDITGAEPALNSALKCLRAAGCHIVQIDLNQTFGYPNRDHKNQPLLFCVPAPPQNAGYIRSDT